MVKSQRDVIATSLFTSLRGASAAKQSRRGEIRALVLGRKTDCHCDRFPLSLEGAGATKQSQRAGNWIY